MPQSEKYVAMEDRCCSLACGHIQREGDLSPVQGRASRAVAEMIEMTTGHVRVCASMGDALITERTQPLDHPLFLAIVVKLPS